MRSFMYLIGFTLALFLPRQDILADTGLINRAPMKKSVMEKSNLDKLAESLGNVAKSMDQIVAEPDVIKTEEEQLIAEPVENKTLPSKVPAKQVPIKAQPAEKNITPTPVLATPAISKPASIKVSDEATVKVQTIKIVATQTEPATQETIVQQNILEPTFLKLGIRGNELKEDAGQWACVVDMRSGLSWEVKNSNGGLRDKKHSYSWFDPSHENLKGIADGGRCKGGIQCDTNAYIQALNAQNFCGHSDWRLPTREEIQQLVEMGHNKTEATINQKLFPDTEPSW